MHKLLNLLIYFVEKFKIYKNESNSHRKKKEKKNRACGYERL